MLSANNRVRCEDQKFDSNETGSAFPNHLFVRVGAKEKTFANIDFKYSIFDGCYLRGCRFLNCDFTGCRFLSTSFHGSTFSNCNFAYATFERTLIADDILETQAPVFENQKVRFARALRVNYQQLGESESVNKAIKIELQATRTHLYEAWHSKKDYYREKYRGSKRASYFLRWLWFSILHLLWGNGESATRLVVSLLFLFFLMGIYDAIHVGDVGRVQSYWHGFCVAPEVFLGIRSAPQYSHWYLTAAATARLLSFAALTSILLKRFSRR
jgi:hypothetical protein